MLDIVYITSTAQTFDLLNFIDSVAGVENKWVSKKCAEADVAAIEATRTASSPM